MCDSWEHGQRLPGGATLSGADPDKPDIYVQYDWMGYGPMETGCYVQSDCSINAGLQGFTCTGPPKASAPSSCIRSCARDTDCASLGGAHITDRCGVADGVRQCLHTHDPSLLVPNRSGGSLALDAVVNAFREHGINLHIERGHELPHSHVLSERLLADPAHPGNVVSDSCEGGSLASRSAGLGKYAESFYDLKARSFDPRQAAAYHYVIFGHYSSCDTEEHCNSCPSALNPDGSPKTSDPAQLGISGKAEFFGNDFMVTLGNLINEIGDPPTQFNVGGTFMHELGHNLGLSHGGGSFTDGTAESVPNYKPNYLSVMNYAYQFVGVGVAERPGDNTAKSRRLDYSNQALPVGGSIPGVLYEAQLDEKQGLGSGNSSTFFFTDGMCNFREAATTGPVDWNGDGVAGDAQSVIADLNPPDHPALPCGSVTDNVFRGHTDWGPAPGQSIFTYKFQCTPFSADGASASGLQGQSALPPVWSGPELTPAMAARMHALYPLRSVHVVLTQACNGQTIAPGLSGTLSVAILGEEDLDVTDVELSSLRLHGAQAVSTTISDINGDGRPDLLVQFDPSQTKLHPEARSISISGWLKNSQPFSGDYAIRTSPDISVSCQGPGR